MVCDSHRHYTFLHNTVDTRCVDECSFFIVRPAPSQCGYLFRFLLIPKWYLADAMDFEANDKRQTEKQRTNSIL